jgi:metal-sulfur cluster biosynthetic enzyme
MTNENNKLPLVESEIRNSLTKVIDPEFDMDIINLGLIYEIIIDGRRVEVDITMTDPACPIIEQIVAAVRLTIHKDFGLALEQIKINVVWSPRWTWEMMTDEAKIAMGFSV